MNPLYGLASISDSCSKGNIISSTMSMASWLFGMCDSALKTSPNLTPLLFSTRSTRQR